MQLKSVRCIVWSCICIRSLALWKIKVNIEAVVVYLYLFLCTYHLRYFNNLKICYIWYRLFNVGNYPKEIVTFCIQSSQIWGLKLVMHQCFWFQCWQGYSLSKDSFSFLGKSNKITGIINLLCFLALKKKNPNLSSFCILNCCLTWFLKMIFSYLSRVCGMSSS